nr:hypothetical protein B0A51_06508 [Rachicladosporium sp. CCFEE 5018]
MQFSLERIKAIFPIPLPRESRSIYVPLNAGDSSESFDQASEKLSNGRSVEELSTGCRCQQQREHWSTTQKLLWAGVTLSTIAVLTAVIAFTSRPSCIRQVAQPSPLLYDLEVKYHDQLYNGSFLKENVYRGPAGPKTDAAWEALGVNYRAAVVPEARAEAAGMSRDKVRISSEFGGGYPANVEGLHHLHCLNLLRQSLYYNFDHYQALGKGAFMNPPHIVQKHVTHCLDILRQQLMCTVDIGLLGQVWYQPPDKRYPEAFVDFNTKHTCRNFDEVREWARVRQVPEEPPRDYLATPEEGQRIWNEIP